MVKFTGDDLDTINRVVVDAGNALAASTAGRVQMAEQLLQMKLLDTPEQFMQVINTGNLRTMTQNLTDELVTIKAVNENLLTGENVVIAVFTDKHSLHLREHRAVLADPALRVTNPELINRVADHVQEHVKLLRETDPAILALFGEQALGPAQGSPVNPGTVAPDQMPAGAAGELPGQMANPEAAGAGAGVLEPTLPGQSPKTSLPSPAQPPELPVGQAVQQTPGEG